MIATLIPEATLLLEGTGLIMSDGMVCAYELGELLLTKMETIETRTISLDKQLYLALGNLLSRATSLLSYPI